MSVESWAQKIVQDELQESVVVHDNNSQPGMCDLRIGPAECPTLAIECVGAVDRVRTETWNVGPGRGPLTAGVAGRLNGCSEAERQDQGSCSKTWVILHGTARRDLRRPRGLASKSFPPEAFPRAQLQRRSGAPDCHPFVIVDYAGAPWPVQSYLDSDLAALPAVPRTLPSPLTGAWLVSTSNTTGVRWTGTHWRRFKPERYGA